MCIIRSVLIGSRILELIKKQESELKRIYKKAILYKLGLSEKIFRSLLHVYEIVIRVRLL